MYRAVKRKPTLEMLRKIGRKSNATGEGIKMQSIVAKRRPVARRRK